MPLDLMVADSLIHLNKYNGQPIGIELPQFVELTVTYAEPDARGDTASRGETRSSASRPDWNSAFLCSSRKAKR